MNPPPSQEDLFDRALALPADERGPWLAQACRGDVALRRRIESLLRAHSEAASFMEDVPPDLAEAGAHCAVIVEEKPGDRIGRYKLLQKIGEGGCGIVYMAEQEEAVRRLVALKIIKLGMDTKVVIARFEAERQALARMEHPNIARVLDAGATSSGRPFFVMELVRGLRITDYCDQNNLSTERRLDLFIKVCQAIQHAHQKGVIHRDIKPSNILVTLHDGEPVPKVIDFGIAKATQGRLTERTLFTAFEQFIGTPAYVSPEQAEMSSLDIDTRSDIYSLGVLLYELLTGRTPFDTRTLVEAGLDEMRRQIREQEPPRPSHRLRTLDDATRTTVASRRSTDVPRLTLRLRGDLDWIVMRCLEKNRSRRYETASSLALDIQRHLRNEPVDARPPNTAYLIQKLIRRHRYGFAAGTAIVAVLVIGFIVSTTLYVQERRSRERANAAEGKALAEKARAELATLREMQARAEAEKGQALARRHAELAATMSSTIKDIGLLVALGNDPRAQREFLEQTARRKKDFDAPPEVEAGVDETLAGAFFKMGDFPRAEELFREALALRRRAQGEAAPEVAQVLNYLGLVASAQSRWAAAEAHHRDALQIYQDKNAEGPDIARTHSALGTVLAQQAKLADAADHLRLALAQQRRLSGIPQRDVAATLTRLGRVLLQADRLGEAEDLLKEALALNETAFGRESLEVAGSLNFLAIAISLDQTRVGEGIAMYREAFEIRQRVNAPVSGAASVASASIANSSPGTAMAGPGPRVGAGASIAGAASLESILSQRSALSEVEAALHDAQLFATAQFGRDSWEEAFYHALRVWIMLQEHRHKDAEPVARQCLATRTRLRPDDWSTHHARHLLGATLAGQGRFAEAEPLLLDGYRGMKAMEAGIPRFHLARLGESAQRISLFYTLRGDAAKAAEWKTEFDRLAPEARKVLLAAPMR